MLDVTPAIQPEPGGRVIEQHVVGEEEKVLILAPVHFAGRQHAVS